MKKLVKVVAPVLVLAGSVFMVQMLSAAKPAPEKKEESQRLISLYVDEVQADNVVVSIHTQGEVRPKTEIDLVPQVSGRVVAIADVFAEGAEFAANTLLLKIDDTDYKFAVIRAEAKVAEAQTMLEKELANKKNKDEQWKGKKNRNDASPYALNQPQVAEAKAKLRAANADLAAAEVNLSRTEIKVPFHGRVREKSIGVGQYVTAGTSLGRVFSTDIVEVRLPLTDIQLAELQLPMGFMASESNAPQVKFTARVGNKSHAWHGKIVRTNASVDQQTRMIYAVAEVQDPYGAGADGMTPIAVGMFVRAEIEGVSSQAALVLPRLALRNNNTVYVVNDENRLEIRTVDILSTSPDTVFVSTGLVAGDKVVTSTIPTAVDGMEVRALTRIATEIVTDANVDQTKT